MDNTDRNRRVFIEQLARENRGFYGTPDGRGVLRAFELTFEHSWTYIFELVQNALDAGARSIALRIAEDGDALTFQHDGHRSMGEKDVEGLSKVFRSTKGASTVGFMGVGFKSVFSRFQEARVSGWGWTFRYEITQVTGEEYGDVQPDLLGAVVPIWDDAIAAPDSGFTTRFEMRRRTDAKADLESDLAHFLPDDDRTPLAILAASGLERLTVDDRVWEMGVAEKQGGSSAVTARSDNEILLWQLFPVLFKPSTKAIARFLEHRSISPNEDEREQVYADAARPRRVLGLLPLDNDGMPTPPARGRVYATLPTAVTLPFGLHINADWLLNMSRSGVREIEDDAWQCEIVDRIADVLARFLGWVSRSFSTPAAVRAAFGALASPTAERSGLEAQLAGEGWRSRLRNCLEEAAVFPVWNGEDGALGFAKPGGLILPPAPLAEAFADEPDLRPPVLLQGPVLMSGLGADALDLLESIGLFAEMSPRALKRAWPGGLKNWWMALADEPERRWHLLFRIWAAIAALTDEDAWQDVGLPCCRTVAGKWLPVREVVFLNEPLPSKREPGGPEVRQFIEPFIPSANRVPDKLIVELRQGAAREARERQPGTLSQAWNWFNDHARSVGLLQVVAEAMRSLVSSPLPDWSALIPLGHWAKHRNRPDLLTLVQVDTESGPKGIPAGEALLADPYVERGRDRQRLFPTVPVISADYFEQDPKHADAREWRTFLEKTGTKGLLVVRPLEVPASRWNRERVAKFLGLEIDTIGESNNNGYTLLDFDIEPDLPAPGAPEELRAALAAWLEDGYRTLKDKGRRRYSYIYRRSYDCRGNRPSAWVARLSELAWVPCRDGELRRPQEALPHPDPALEQAPVAKLSSELLSMLMQEGVKFGSAIPKAPSLQKLSAMGSRLDAEALAQLLRECREQITTDDDRGHFEEVVRELTIPSSNSERVPLARIVRRAGRGDRLRGALDGWVVSLDRIDEVLRMELEHPNFPYRFPDTTTGRQALAYLRDVWKSAQVSPERLANAVSDVLPAAYAYCLEDCAKDAPLSEQWREAVAEATVFVGREWIVVAEADDIYFDDLEDRRFFPSEVRLRTITSGHLGNTWTAQIRAAEAIGLPRLSSSVTMEWHVEDETSPVPGDWSPRFDLICELLRWVRGNDRAEGDRTGTETGTRLKLICVHGLALDVSVGSAPADRVPINARLHGGVLTVAGRPVQFGADAAKELLRHFSFGQRGNLAADLTGIFGAIDDASDFILAVDKFRRSFAPDFELPTMFQTGSGDENTADSEDGSLRTMERQTDVDKSAPTSALSNRSKTEKSRSSDNVSVPGPNRVSSASGHDESESTGGSYTRARALAKQNALADQLRNSLKGEIEPSADDDSASKTPATDGNSGASLGDEIYRKVVAQYEKEAGREPELGDPRQTGWDIRSIDPKTGDVRLIEVKGKGCPWVGDEIVEISQAQARKAWQMNSAWYLYVVERTNNGSFTVLPIGNPVQRAGKWILCGQSWRMLAEESRRVTHSDLSSDC